MLHLTSRGSNVFCFFQYLNQVLVKLDFHSGKMDFKNCYFIILGLCKTVPGCDSKQKT